MTTVAVPNFMGFQRAQMFAMPAVLGGNTGPVISAAMQTYGAPGMESLALSPAAQFAVPPDPQVQMLQMYMELWMLEQQLAQLPPGSAAAQQTQAQLQSLQGELGQMLQPYLAPPPPVEYPNGGGPPGSGPEVGGGPGPNAVPVNPNQFHGGTQTGRQLASIAFQHATDGTGDGHHCYTNVAQDLARIGINVTGEGAWEAADQLARNSKVQEVTGLSTQDLTKLPPGAIVVWNRGNGHEYGHISIAMGDGHEASDVMRDQTQHYGTSFRVFLPRDGSQLG